MLSPELRSNIDFLMILFLIIIVTSAGAVLQYRIDEMLLDKEMRSTNSSNAEKPKVTEPKKPVLPQMGPDHTPIFISLDLARRAECLCEAGYETLPSGMPALQEWLSSPSAITSMDLEALASTLVSLLPKFSYRGSTTPAYVPHGASQQQLLAQAEATTHKPLGFASTPSLPGTINSPWWTDFAHLIYWFYFVATFTTVAFLFYLYDLKVRRVETAHPIRETRGFSRAQTGDLVTAILPLTWSATMVMHASTHSINFDENTAGTVFSLTVVAYQWGWNYYFPRDIVTQLEAAPRIVGRGRVVSFEATPVEAAPVRHLDAWALRATIGNRQGSRTGRLNASPALALILPTDVGAGSFSAAAANADGRKISWRHALTAAMADMGTMPYTATTAEADVTLTTGLGLETPTLFRSRPSVYIAGSRLTLAYRHLAPALLPASYATLSWVTCNVGLSDVDPQVRTNRSLFIPSAAPTLPALENLAGANKDAGASLALLPREINLDRARRPFLPSVQHLIWTGPDAVTGAANSALCSTEDHGWLTPVTAREASLRSALATKAAVAEQRLVPACGLSPLALLMPFEANSRVLLSHEASSVGLLPFTWTAASVALDSEIDTASLDVWVHALAPEVSLTSVRQPTALVNRRNSIQSLRALQLSPSLGHVVQPLRLAPMGLSEPLLRGKNLTHMPIAEYLMRPQGAAFVETSHTALNMQPLMATHSRLSAVRPARGHGSFGGMSPLVPHALKATKGRIQFAPSSLGFGLDENRLVRSGTSRLADSTLFASKLESLGGATLMLPLTPASLLSRGWSTSASLAAYPSYKIARGGMFRRPFTGLSAAVRPLEGIKAEFTALNLGKNITHLGIPTLELTQPLILPFKTTAPSLDTQLGAWAAVWAVLTPAPTEDLDPTFINMNWTPEVNTSRRSDHNSRYRVSWSPLVGAVTTGSPFDAALSGPSVLAAQSPSLLRTSVLALNQLGLKNSSGVRDVKPALVQTLASCDTSGSRLLSTMPASLRSSQSLGTTWVALWGAFPSLSTNSFVNSASQYTPERLSGRGATLLTARATLLVGGMRTPLLASFCGGDKLSPLTDALAKLELSHSALSDGDINPRQGYVPLSSDISASRRLRVTKGVTLPSDTPMHIICGSKDVIHSWAIPGLNVKIDCIPGYNSHRRLLLRWRGAYWGQCMEVCGRYHHWMPIMVNVAHPALFVDWCLTFLRGLDTQTANGPVSLPSAELARLLRALSEAN